MTAVTAAAKTAARQLSQDLTALKTDKATEKKKLGNIDAQLKKDVDAFVSSPPGSVGKELSLLTDVFTLVLRKQTVADKFDKRIAGEVTTGKALLPKAEPALTREQINKDRALLGMKQIDGPPPATGKKTGKDALDFAKSMLGKNIATLKKEGPLVPYLDKWVGNKICCANFVSACLAEQGLIDKSQHTDHTRTLAKILGKDKDWSAVSSTNMKPGDVVCFNVPGEGHYAHTEFFAGYKNGKPTYVGSNNVNPDFTQRISYGHGYPVDAVFRYHG